MEQRKTVEFKRTGGLVTSGLTILVLGLLPTMALAGDARIELGYSPQELASISGVAKVHERIRRIARAACPSYGESREMVSNRECRSSIEQQLVERVNHAGLTAFHSEGKSGLKLPDVALADR